MLVSVVMLVLIMMVLIVLLLLLLVWQSAIISSILLNANIEKMTQEQKFPVKTVSTSTKTTAVQMTSIGMEQPVQPTQQSQNTTIVSKWRMECADLVQQDTIVKDTVVILVNITNSDKDV